MHRQMAAATQHTASLMSNTFFLRATTLHCYKRIADYMQKAQCLIAQFTSQQSILAVSC